MTVQKQNVVTAVLGDLLAFAAVWYIRCLAVNQSNPEAGQNSSTADMTYAIQQDANDLFVGQVSESSQSITLLS